MTRTPAVQYETAITRLGEEPSIPTLLLALAAGHSLNRATALRNATDSIARGVLGRMIDVRI